MQVEYRGWRIETRSRNCVALRWAAVATDPDGNQVERYGVNEEGAVELVKHEIDNRNERPPRI